MTFKEIKPSDFKRPNRPVKAVYIHCTAVDSFKPAIGVQLVKNTDRFHREVRKWSAVGYHFMIDKLGNLITARDIESTPAAQAGHNSGSIAICLDGLDIKLFSDLQKETLKEFCSVVNKAYRGKISFWPHNKVSPKTCPVIDVYSLLGIDKETGRIKL